MKTDKDKKLFLEQLRKIPVVQICCEKLSISRASVYRWRAQSEKFRNEMEKAITEGEAMVNDLSESQILALIKDGNFPAISLWLRSHHPKYGNKLEVTGGVSVSRELTDKEKQLLEKALRLAMPKKKDE